MIETLFGFAVGLILGLSCYYFGSKSVAKRRQKKELKELLADLERFTSMLERVKESAPRKAGNTLFWGGGGVA
jgi:hypothetical protein